MGRKPLRAGVDKALLARLRFLAHRFQLLSRFEAIVCFLLVEQLANVSVVNILALGLRIRSVRTTFVGSFIPIDPEPAQVGHDLSSGSRGIPFLVGVFDPKDETPACPAGPKPVEQRRPSAANVQIARRRRCKPRYDVIRHDDSPSIAVNT